MDVRCSSIVAWQRCGLHYSFLDSEAKYSSKAKYVPSHVDIALNLVLEYLGTREYVLYRDSEAQ